LIMEWPCRARKVGLTPPGTDCQPCRRRIFMGLFYSTPASLHTAEVVTLYLRDGTEFVARHQRHNLPAVGCKLAIGTVTTPTWSAWPSVAGQTAPMKARPQPGSSAGLHGRQAARMFTAQVSWRNHPLFAPAWCTASHFSENSYAKTTSQPDCSLNSDTTRSTI
jgi:hypothetical protein